MRRMVLIIPLLLASIAASQTKTDLTPLEKQLLGSWRTANLGRDFPLWLVNTYSEDGTVQIDIFSKPKDTAIHHKDKTRHGHWRIKDGALEIGNMDARGDFQRLGVAWPIKTNAGGKIVSIEGWTRVTESTSPPATRPSSQSQPERIVVRGTYVHQASKITMPESIAGFQREAVVRYDTDGRNVSAGYNLVGPSHQIAATVYVYPAPPVVSIGSPPDVVATARAPLSRDEFERRKQEIQRAHPGARLIDERDTARIESGQSYPGKLAVFEYEQVFAGLRMPVRSHLYLFCYIGDKWIVKYRFTHPKAEDAGREIQEFIQKWSWYAESD